MLKKLFGWGKKDSDAGREGDKTHPGVDPSMNYCPQCGDEYRAGITRCHVCEVELLSGVQKVAMLQEEARVNGERSMEISPDDSLVAIRNGKLRDLKPYQVLLARHTIPVLLTGESGGCSKGWGGPDLQLEVKEQDARIAVEILQRDYQKTTALSHHDLSTAQAIFDEQAGEVQCPACGISFTPTSTTCPECGLSFG